MAKRKIRIRSGELEAWMEVTEEEYQEYYRPWWQQKKREQRNREAMEEQGYKEEPYEEWKENDMRTELFAESMEELLGGECYRGLDLSGSIDIKAFVLVFPPRNDTEKYIILPYFRMSEENMVQCVRRDYVPYDVWEKQGYLMTTEGIRCCGG